MGLIDFIKGAGEKLFGSDESDQDVATKDPHSANQKASEALERLVQKMNIQVNDLDVQFTAGVATITGKTEDQATAEKAALVVGNISGVNQVDNRIQVLNPQPEAVYYTVQSGDSLSKIAKVQYGDAMKYPVIFEANRPMLKDPDKIYPGQVLRIPPLNG